MKGTGTGTEVCRFSALATNCNVVVTNCTVEATSTTSDLFAMLDFSGTPVRSLTLTNCTLTGGTAGGKIAALTDYTNFTCSGCTITGQNDTWDLNGVSTTTDIHGNTITGVSSSGTFATDLADFTGLTSLTSLFFYSNIGTNLRNGIMVTLPGIIYIGENDLTVNQDANSDFIYQIGTNAIPTQTETLLSAYMMGVRVTNNKGRMTGADTLVHGMLIGGNMVGATVQGNDVQGADRGLVIKGTACHVCNNFAIGHDPFVLSGAQGCLVEHNAFYAQSGNAFEWSDNTGSGTQNPKSNIVQNNVFDASGGGDYAIYLGASSATSSQWIDNNMFVAGTLGFAYAGGAPYATHADLIDAVAWHNPIGEELDANSRVELASPFYQPGLSWQLRFEKRWANLEGPNGSFNTYGLGYRLPTNGQRRGLISGEISDAEYQYGS
jgi:hypothetical protein